MTILLKKFIRFVLNWVLDYIGRAQKFSFPEKYIWRWKRDFLFGRYEKDTVAMFNKTIKTGMVVVDIGAHIGYYTRILSKLVGKKGAVYAFEADPENFKLLEKNTGHLSNVKRYQTAVMDRAGTVDFYHCEEKSGSHSVVANIPVNLATRKISVQSADLDGILAGEDVATVDFIKMDIEGGEPIALRGMRNTLTKNNSIQMVFEFAPAWISAGGVKPERFLEEIFSMGFKIFAANQDGFADFYVYNPFDPRNTDPEYFFNIYCKRLIPPRFLK